jgi:hypothetical protein
LGDESILNGKTVPPSLLLIFTVAVRDVQKKVALRIKAAPRRPAIFIATVPVKGGRDVVVQAGTVVVEVLLGTGVSHRAAAAVQVRAADVTTIGRGWIVHGSIVTVC